MTRDYEPDAHLEMDYEDRVSGNVDDDVGELDYDVEPPDDGGDNDDEDLEDEFEVPDLPPAGLADFDDLLESFEPED